MEMSNMTSQPLNDKAKATHVDAGYTDAPELTGQSSSGRGVAGTEDGQTHTRDEGDTIYRVYKIRWFGLAALVLLNIVVSWDVSILLDSLE